jgi:hypothetical protein
MMPERRGGSGKERLTGGSWHCTQWRFKMIWILSNGFKYNSNSFKLDLIQKGSSWVQKNLKNMVVKYLMRGTTLLIGTSPDLKVNLN